MAVLLEYCGQIAPAFFRMFQFLFSCDFMWPYLYCVADLLYSIAMLTGCKMYCVADLLNGSDADLLYEIVWRC